MSLIRAIFEDYRHHIPSQLAKLIDHESPLDEGEARNRIFRAQTTITVISKTMGFSDNSWIGVGFTEHVLDIILYSTVEDEQKGNIHLPLLFLLRRKEIFFSGPNDPDLDNVGKVQKFADYLAKKFSFTKQKISFFPHCHYLKMYLHLLQKPEAAKKAILFGIGHELGHIFEGHKGNKYHQQNIFLFKVPFLIKELKLTRVCEAKADYFSYSHSIEFAEGGKYLFEMIERGCSGSYPHKILNVILRIIIGITHHSCSSRRMAIEKHWPQLQNNQKKGNTMINNLFKVAVVVLHYIFFK